MISFIRVASRFSDFRVRVGVIKKFKFKFGFNVWFYPRLILNPDNPDNPAILGNPAILQSWAILTILTILGLITIHDTRYTCI